MGNTYSAYIFSCSPIDAQIKPVDYFANTTNAT